MTSGTGGTKTVDRYMRHRNSRNSEYTRDRAIKIRLRIRGIYRLVRKAEGVVLVQEV